MSECPKCGKAAKLIEAGIPWSSYYCGPCNIFFWIKSEKPNIHSSEDHEDAV